jgi:mono/diheme cytochrome c family protein
MLKEILQNWSPPWRQMRWNATLVGIAVGAVVAPLAILAIPYWDLLNDMAVQPKGKAQGQYGWFSGEQIQVYRPPVPGTVPMGYASYVIDEQDKDKAVKLAEETLVNPLKPTTEVLARGRRVFETICWTCHGIRAEADGGIVGPGLFPAPPSLHTKEARAFKDGRIFHIITRGQNKMPSYAGIVKPDDRWAVIHYVRALQRAKQMSTEGK